MLTLASLLLLTAALVPDRLANRSPRTIALLSSLCLAVLFIDNAILAAFQGRLELWGISTLVAPGPLVYFDNLTAVMVALISFIGLLIVQFSTRYVDGEATHGRFMKWLSFTLGAVTSMVIAGNLIALAAAWIMTSCGLHQLLTHYRDRHAAVLAARKKFLISRIGDILILAAIALIYFEYNTFAYSELFETISRRSAGSSLGWSTTLIGLCLAAGALTKSAQFPLHTWLPETLETPTPVSALMHAGIINGGGFLIIRLSPLMSISPAGLYLLAWVGGFTAIFGGLVMMCQTSIKRKLAYSTVAQMGFMILQCGLGAFSAALLHIVAHSLYKAYAFLNSGTLPSERQPVFAPKSPVATWLVERSASVVFQLACLALGGAITVTMVYALGFTEKLFTIQAVLTVVFSLALAFYLQASIRQGQPIVTSLVRSIGLAALYGLGLVAFEEIQPMHYGAFGESLSDAGPLVLGTFSLLSFGFVGAYLLQFSTFLPAKKSSLYVHALNGFYIDVIAHRIVAAFTLNKPIARRA